MSAVVPPPVPRPQEAPDVQQAADEVAEALVVPKVEKGAAGAQEENCGQIGTITGSSWFGWHHLWHGGNTSHAQMEAPLD